MTQGSVQGRAVTGLRGFALTVLVGAAALWSAILGAQVLHTDITHTCDDTQDWGRCGSTVRTLKGVYVAVALLLIAGLAASFFNKRARRHAMGLTVGVVFAVLVLWVIVNLEFGGAYMS